jgi:hypothetical protein
VAVYFPDAPDVLAQDQAAIARGLAEAMAATHASQAEAATFIRVNGHEVIGGHADTHGPGGGAARS